MRACVIALAVIALTQPALAAKSHKKSHRHHVSHLSHHHHYAAHNHHGHAYMRANANDGRTFFNPFFPNWSWQQNWQQNWQQAWTSPLAPQAGEYRSRRTAHARNTALDASIARHAAANGLPVELVHRVVKRESGYNPGARNRGALGLMQIKYQTARGVGYTGSPAGLMDPETNLTYATRYLAGAYRAAGGNQNRAVALYASGYYRRGAPRETQVASATPWPMMMPWQAQTQRQWQ